MLFDDLLFFYCRTGTTSESSQGCDKSHYVEKNGPNSASNNAYQMTEDVNTNEDQAIPRNVINDYNEIPGQPNDHLNSSNKYYAIPGSLLTTQNPSNKHQVERLQNNYNKLYFSPQDNVTSLTYGKLNQENNASPSSTS